MSLVEVRLPADRIVMDEGVGLQLVATVTRNGVEWAGAPISWRSEAPSVASVDATGLITGVAPGGTRVFAELDKTFAVIYVSVLSRCRVSAISVGPATLRLRVSERAQPTARGPCNSPSPPTFQWRSTDTLVARVDSAGRITGRSVGTSIVTATLSSDATKSAAIRVDVDP